VVVVVVGTGTQVPSAVGAFALNAVALFVMVDVGPNDTEYRSPPVIVSATHASVPGLGGTMSSPPFVPTTFARTTNLPFATRWMRAVRTGPLCSFVSAYL